MDREGNLVHTRILKIQRNLHRILMDYFLTKSARSYPGVISVKEVNLQSDLKKAGVYISVMGSLKDVQMTRLRLEEDRLNIRDLVNRRLRMKYCPYFKFFVNHITWPLSAVEKKLAELRKKREV